MKLCYGIVHYIKGLKHTGEFCAARRNVETARNDLPMAHDTFHKK